MGEISIYSGDMGIQGEDCELFIIAEKYQT